MSATGTRNCRLTLDTKTFPDNWNSTPWHDYTIETGTEWLNSQDSLMLKIPSAIAPKENIYVVNPKRGDFEKIKIVSKETFEPDNRLVLKSI